MPDIGSLELALIALIALIVIGPKELPHAMRAATKWIRKARSLAREFQSGVDDMVREADLEDARKAVQTAEDFDIEKTVTETIDPTGDMRGEAEEVTRAAKGDDEKNQDLPAIKTPDTAPEIESPREPAPAAEAGNDTAKRA